MGGILVTVLETTQKVLEQRRLITLQERERRQSQAALRESERQLRQLAEAISNVFWLFDLRSSQLLYISPAYPSLVTLSREYLE